MNKLWCKLCSILLVIVMVVNMLPMNVLAEEYITNKTSTKAATSTTNARIVEEITDKRTEYTKEFKLSNGLQIAAVYSDAVHFEKDGQWAEIDNTLISKFGGGYRNTDGVWDVTFPGNIGNGNVVIEKDGYTLSFAMAGELRQSGNLDIMGVELETEVQTVLATEAPAVKETQPEEIQETEPISTEPVQEENALVEEQEGADPAQVNVGDMIPVLQEDGSIIFYDKNREEVVLFMPAPYLVDNNGAHNEDIHVSLTGGNGVYSLIYILPQAWLAAPDRAWPVVLDPVVQPNLARSNIRDVTYDTKSVDSNNHGILKCGYSIDRASHCRFLVKYRNLPILTSSDVIVSSSLQIYKPYNTDPMVPVEAHKVLDTWESESLTINNIPDFDAQVEDYTLVEGSGYYTWDITDIAQGWYEGENTGILFKTNDATEADTSQSTLKEFYSSDGVMTAYRPTLTIIFRNNNGLESYWDYTSSSAGRAGTGYVNNFTGNMVWVRSDMGFGGNRMPVSINHVYNLNDAANNTFAMGYG